MVVCFLYFMWCQNHTTGGYVTNIKSAIPWTLTSISSFTYSLDAEKSKHIPWVYRQKNKIWIEHLYACMLYGPIFIQFLSNITANLKICFLQPSVLRSYILFFNLYRNTKNNKLSSFKRIIVKRQTLQKNFCSLKD